MNIFHILQLCLGIFAGTLESDAESPRPPHSNELNPLVWDAVEKKLELPGMTNSVLVTFWVTNQSAADAIISSVEADCDCIVVEAKNIFPWTIAPGEGGPVNIRANTRGRFGDFVRMVIVHTPHGPQALTVNLKIPLTPAPSNVSIRQKDLMAAKVDRQAVFRGGCAACHAAPTFGMTGAALFQKACGICHQAEQRADLVPNLAALKHSTDPEYWRRWITSGRVGTVMPAFAISEGGILDTNQIESLVEYAIKEFPSVHSSAGAQPQSAESRHPMSRSSILPEHPSDHSSAK